MNFIGINTGSTSDGIKEFQKLLGMLSKKENVVYAKIRYDKRYSIESYVHPIRYPLVIYTNDGYAFCLADVAAGYGGTGPHGLVEVLNWLKFNFDENDILKVSNPSIPVQLDYFIDDSMELKSSFKGYDPIFYEYLTTPFKPKGY